MTVISDPLGDTLTRIRNGQRAGKNNVKVLFSSLHLSVLIVLKKEGYIHDFKEFKNQKGIKEINIELKYFESSPVIREIKRISKPGRRIYSKIKKLKVICNGLGVAILSTPKGIMSDHEARKMNVGGEVLCTLL
jgi:small subunit ribosomal protein S8